MTGGRAVILGPTGWNFAAGMSGGIAYVLDLEGNFERRCNPAMVDLEPLDADDSSFVRDLVARHVDLTNSHRGQWVLDNWEALLADSGVEGDETRFTTRAVVKDEYWGSGSGRTKRAAEFAAAQEGLARLEGQGAGND